MIPQCDSSSSFLVLETAAVLPSSMIEFRFSGSNRESDVSKGSQSDGSRSNVDSVGEGGNGMAWGATIAVEDMGGKSGISEGTGFRFCGVILLRLDLLGFVGDDGAVEVAMDDGSDDLESLI